MTQSDGPVGPRCASEISGVDIIKGKSGRVYLFSDKARIIAKGGFSSGKCLACKQADCRSFGGSFWPSKIGYEWAHVFLAFLIAGVPFCFKYILVESGDGVDMREPQGFHVVGQWRQDSCSDRRVQLEPRPVQVPDNA